MLQGVTIEWVEMFFSTNNWGKADQDDQLGNAFLAAAMTMITSAILQTNDPVRIARFSGLPTPYVSSVVWNWIATRLGFNRRTANWPRWFRRRSSTRSR